MERDAITFAVKNQRAETVGANLVFWLKHFAAVRRRLISRFRFYKFMTTGLIWAAYGL